MSAKRKRSAFETESTHQDGLYSSTVYFNSLNAREPLSAQNNVLNFSIPRTIEGVRSVKTKEFVMTNTLSPFTEEKKMFRWVVHWVDESKVDEVYTIDLGFEEYAFDRSNITQLGAIMNEVMNPASGPNPTNVSDTKIEVVYDEVTDYIGFVLRSNTLATQINGVYELRFPADDSTYLGASNIFGLYENVPSSTIGVTIGVAGYLGEPEANYSKDSSSEDYNALVVWSNGALVLEGDTSIIIRCGELKNRSIHSVAKGDTGDAKGVMATNVMEILELGTARGGKVRYGDINFPLANYRGGASLSGDVSFSFWHASGEKPRFAYNTPCRIVLEVEYDDD